MASEKIYAENATVFHSSTESTTTFIENNGNESINEQLKFIIVPLGVIVTVMFLSALVKIPTIPLIYFTYVVI